LASAGQPDTRARPTDRIERPELQESVVVNPTLLADPAAAPESEQPSVTGSEPPANGAVAGAPPPDEGLTAPASASARACPNCGAALDDGQDWCLQCGAGAPGSLAADGPGWRSAATILAATAVLVLGAAAAAYAVLSKPAPRKLAPRVVTTIAQTPPPTTTLGTATTTPAVPTPGATATIPGALGTPTTIKPLPGTTKPPKIPLTAPTPKSSGTTTTPPTTGSTGAGTGTGTGTTGTTSPSTKSSGGTTPPTPILLDTNAASTYNPYGYPAGGFGDPSLAIDGEPTTGWTAEVQPTTAPKMAEGLVIDLNTAQRVSAITLITSTPGMTVQVFGSNGHTLPSSITAPAWVALSAAKDAKKRTTHLKLRDASKSFRFIALWISQAPSSASGAPQAPGHVSVNELELFPPK
jgi:hypothetical protein